MKSKLSGIFVLLLLVLAALTPANAQVEGREWVKWEPADGVPVRQGWHIEWFLSSEVRIEGTNNGEFGVAWADTRNGDRGIFVQLVDVDGNLKFAENGIQIADTTNRQEDPGIWPSRDGGWFIAWEDFDIWPVGEGDNRHFEGDSLGDIYCTKINGDGEILWGNTERGVPVCVTRGIQESVRIVEDNDGGCIIAWKDQRSGDTGDIYAMHILSNGTPDPNWPENGLAIVAEAGAQTGHTADTDDQGGMIIGWKDGRDAGDLNVWAQRVTPEGELLWGDGEGTIVCGLGDSNQESPKLCPDGSHGAFFIWVDNRNLAQTNKDIYAQRVDENGELMWNEAGEAVCTADREQTGCRIVASANGEAIVLWEDKRNDNLTYDLYSMRISGVNQMEKLWNPSTGFPIAVEEANQQAGRLFQDMEGGAYYVWEDERDGNFPEIDIWAQHVNRNGQNVWAENGIPICRIPANQNSAMVRWHATGGPIFVWGDYRTGSQGIWSQLMEPDGDPVWDENGIPVVEGIGANATKPEIISYENGRFAIVWLDGRYGGLGTAPFIQFYQDAGNDVLASLPLDGIPLMRGIVGDAVSVDACTNGRRGAFAVWEDHRTTDRRYSIYAQHVTYNGDLRWGEAGKQVAPPEEAEQHNPRVVPDGEDGIYVAWQSDEDLYPNIYMQHLDTWGQRLWAEDETWIIQQDLELKIESMISDGEGGVVLVYQVAAGGRRDTDLWVARISADQEFLWGEDFIGQPLCEEDLKQRSAQVISHPEGYIVVWVDGRDDSDGQPQTDIRAQFIEPDGSYRWASDGSLVCGLEYNEDNPSVSVTNDGDIWFAWEDHRYANDRRQRDIYVLKAAPTPTDRRVNRITNELYGEVVVSAELDQITPAIVHDAFGGAWVIWEDSRDGVWTNVFGTHLQPDGTVYPEWGENGREICSAYHKQNTPSAALVTRYGGEGIVAVWEDKRATGKEELYNVYIQRIDDDIADQDVTKPEIIPVGYTLENAYPNPFNSQTILNFTLPGEQLVSFYLYDVSGRQIGRLAEEYWSAGRHQILIDAGMLASGTYLVRMEASGNKLERQIQLIK